MSFNEYLEQEVFGCAVDLCDIPDEDVANFYEEYEKWAKEQEV